MRGSRRRPKESLIPERPYFGDLRPFPGNRDSDASLCSSRPSSSSAGINRSAAAVPINDRSYQSSALRAINTFLSSHSSPTFLKPPLPSAKDITDALRFIFSLLDWPSFKLEEDLPLLLKHLNCPIKLNKSALRAPGTPHAWPSLLAVMHWLVQITLYNDHISSSTSPWASASFLQSNEVFRYICDSYSHYIAGDDDGVEALDRENSDRLEQNSNFAAERVKELEKEVKDLEDKLEATRSAPSAREVLEKEKSVLENDVQKFHHIIEGFSSGVATLEKGLEEKEKELEAKEKECKKICEENEELKRTIDSQKFNARDAERMKRELQAVERDIAEAEEARNAWEEKVWDLDTTLGHKLQELEVLSIECNQAIKKLKLGNDYHYTLNGKGSTPAEVLGIDYKSTLKPALDAFADNVKKSSTSKLKELILLQQQSVETAAKVETKRNSIATLQSRIDEAEAQLGVLKNEVRDHTSRCVAKAKEMLDDVDTEARNLDIVEREAEAFLKISNSKSQDVIKQSEDEMQLCGRELLALVDSVSKYKEHMESTISEMRGSLFETADAVTDVFRGSLPAKVLA